MPNTTRHSDARGAAVPCGGLWTRAAGRERYVALADVSND